MSYVFDDQSGSEVWVPSLGVGKFFIAMTEYLADSIGLPSGLEKLAEDWYKFDPRAYVEFVDKVIKKTWDHSVFRELERGYVAILIVLLGKIGVTAEAEDYAGRLDLESPISLDALRRAMPPH